MCQLDQLPEVWPELCLVWLLQSVVEYIAELNAHLLHGQRHFLHMQESTSGRR